MLLIIAVSGSVSWAQHISNSDVPNDVITTFQKQFPGATDVTWEMEGDEYEVSFMFDNQSNDVIYDESGNWQQIETKINTSELPEQVTSAITIEFADYEIVEASRVSSKEHGRCFKTELKNGSDSLDVLFSSTGETLSTDMEDEEGDSDE